MFEKISATLTCEELFGKGAASAVPVGR